MSIPFANLSGSLCRPLVLFVWKKKTLNTKNTKSGPQSSRRKSREIFQTDTLPAYVCGKINLMAEFPEHGGDVLTESETKLEKPKLFKVLLHNDDFTTMEFVVFVLSYVFQRDEAESVAIMLKVHNQGVGVAGVYPYDIAYMKSNKTMNLAKSREYPLLCTLEEE